MIFVRPKLRTMIFLKIGIDIVRYTDEKKNKQKVREKKPKIAKKRKKGQRKEKRKKKGTKKKERRKNNKI